VKPAEVEWWLLRAERRALDGPEFQSPAVSLAHTIDRLRKLLVEQRAPKAKPVIRKHTTIRVPDEKEPGRPLRVGFVESEPVCVYDYAIDYCKKRIESLLPSVPNDDLSKALRDLGNTGLKNTQQQVLDVCWKIFEQTDSEPDSGLAVHGEIIAMIKKRLGEKAVKTTEEAKRKLPGAPSYSTVAFVLNELEIPTKRGKAGPARGSRHKKTSKNRV